MLEALAGVAGSSIQRLLALFDRAFAPQIADRFMDADAMLAELEKVMEPRTGVQSEAVLQDIIEALGTEAAHRQAATAARLNDALKQIQRVHHEVHANLESSGVPLSWSQGGWSVVEGLGRNTLGFSEAGVFPIEYCRWCARCGRLATRLLSTCPESQCTERRSLLRTMAISLILRSRVGYLIGFTTQSRQRKAPSWFRTEAQVTLPLR